MPVLQLSFIEAMANASDELGGDKARIPCSEQIEATHPWGSFSVV